MFSYKSHANIMDKFQNNYLLILTSYNNRQTT